MPKTLLTIRAEPEMNKLIINLAQKIEITNAQLIRSLLWAGLLQLQTDILSNKQCNYKLYIQHGRELLVKNG